MTNSQYKNSDSSERQRAIQDGWPASKYDPFNRLGRGLAVDGVLDTLAGFVYADAACAFALRKIKQLGAKVILDRVAGKFESLVYAPAYKKVGEKNKQAIGIRTSDGQEHTSDIVIMAAGAQIHELVPGLERILNATGANIVYVEVSTELSTNIPELVGCDILIAKLCWDSFAIDLDFVLDWVPEIENCIVVAGGSGGGTCLPIITICPN